MESDDDGSHHHPDDEKAPRQDLPTGLTAQPKDPADTIAREGSPDGTASPPFSFIGPVAAVVDHRIAHEFGATVPSRPLTTHPSER